MEEMKEKCLNWLENLSSEDIDLLDKVYNLDLENQIVEELINNHETIREEIEKEIKKELLSSDKENYIKEIIENTTDMYNSGCIDDLDDFSSGLYLMDYIYFCGINNVFALGRDVVAK